MGVHVSEARLDIARSAGCIDHVVQAGEASEQVHELTRGVGCEVSVDCSGSGSGRALAISAARRWGRVALVGEGPELNDVDVRHAIIRKQLTIVGSGVTSTKHMEDLVARLVEWRLNPERIVTHVFSLHEAGEAYRTADDGQSGKVCIVMP